MLKEVLLAVAQSPVPLTSRQVAEAVGMDYDLNFNKREMRYARKLEGFIIKRRLTAEEMTTPTHLVHWFIADQWRDRPLDEMIKAFEATTHGERETVQSQLRDMHEKVDQLLSLVRTLIDENNTAIADA